MVETGWKISGIHNTGINTCNKIKLYQDTVMSGYGYESHLWFNEAKVHSCLAILTIIKKGHVWYLAFYVLKESG